MKTLNLIITVILAVAIFSSSAFAIDARDRSADISEEAVKNSILIWGSNNYLSKWNVRIVEKNNVKIIFKNSIITKEGAVVNSYVITADIIIEEYGKCKAVYYIYTGELRDVKHYAVELYFTEYTGYKWDNGYSKAINDYKASAQNNVAVNETIKALYAAM